MANENDRPSTISWEDADLDPRSPAPQGAPVRVRIPTEELRAELARREREAETETQQLEAAEQAALAAAYGMNRVAGDGTDKHKLAANPVQRLRGCSTRSATTRDDAPQP